MVIDGQLYLGDTELYYIGEFAAKIIHSMHQYGTVTITTKETRCYRANGLYEFLDQLSNYYHWDKKKILLTTPRIEETHSEYTVLHSQPIDLANYQLPTEILPWNREKYYGLFIGRANAPRIRAIYNHLHFKYKNQGLASFNDNILKFNEKIELSNYFRESEHRWSDIKDIGPFSDIDNVRAVPIKPGINDNPDIWSQVYKKIAIEIVCETSTRPGCYVRSEKIIRPMLYKRPFMVVAPNGMLKAGRKYGIKTFNSVFDEYYDEYDGVERVDQIFIRLQNLIETGKINTLIEDCQEMIEHNYNFIVHEISRMRKVVGE